MQTTLWLAGDWEGFADLRAEIAAADGVVPAEAGVAEVAICVAADPHAMQDALAAVREQSQAPVVVLAAQVVPGLLEVAIEAQVAETLILPQPLGAIVFAVQKAAATNARPSRSGGNARLLTVFSPKGGTGKSVVSCNLASAFAQAGRRTLLVDLDLQFGDIAIMLGLEPERTLFDLLTAPGALDAEKIAGYASRAASGLHVLAAPLRPEDAELMTDERIGELLAAARDGYDVVVVDTPPLFDREVLVTLDCTDELLLVTAPDVPTMKNVRLALQTLELLSFPRERTRIVLNRASARVGFRAAQVSAVLEQEVAYELPEDETVAIAVNRGTPAVAFRKQSPFSIAVRALVDGIESGDEPAAPARRRRFAVGRRG